MAFLPYSFWESTAFFILHSADVLFLSMNSLLIPKWVLIVIAILVPLQCLSLPEAVLMDFHSTVMEKS